MRKPAILGILLLIIFCSSPVYADFSEETIKNTRSTVVALYADKYLSDFRATGFFINSSGAIITANHVTRNSPKLWALTHDGRKLELSTIQSNAGKDLAILLPKLPDGTDRKNNFSYLKFGDADSLTVGQPVMTIGNSLYHGLWKVLYGAIENLNQKILMPNDIIIDTIKHSAIITKGFSGSPLVDENGRAIGINIGADQSSYAVGIAEIQSFVEEFHKKLPESIKK